MYVIENSKTIHSFLVHLSIHLFKLYLDVCYERCPYIMDSSYIIDM